jgi:outer membrane lipoprotein SlyB
MLARKEMGRISGNPARMMRAQRGLFQSSTAQPNVHLRDIRCGFLPTPEGPLESRIGWRRLQLRNAPRPSQECIMNLISTFVAATALVLSGCSTTSPDVIKREDAQRMSNVLDGVVLSTRDVTVEGSQSGIGTAAGGVVGGVAGSTVGKGKGAIVGTVIGAVAGGVAGNAIERGTTSEQATEILVQLKNGERRAIVQAKGAEMLSAGDAVIIITTGGKARVVRAPRS